jgi:hypothetical protein
MSWDESIRARLKERAELTLSELSEVFGFAAKRDEAAVNECLSLFEEEYGIPIGVLRPEDGLEVFIEPPPAKGILTWLFERAAIEDKASELSYRLKRQRERIGRTPMPVRPPTTIGEYVDCWVGRD